MRLIKFRISWSLLLALAVVTAGLSIPSWSAQASGCTPTAKWSLWTHGQLRGFNVFAEHANPTWETTGPLHFPYTQSDFDQMAAMGANYVQISQPGLFRMRPPYGIDVEAQANLDHLLKMIGNSGMKAVIAFRTGPGRNEYAFRYQNDYDPHFKQHLYETLWNSTQAQTAFVAMMRYTAVRYRSSCVVIGYDPLVEPNYVSVVADETGEYLDPGRFYARYGGTIHDWNLLVPRITKTIRQVDRGTPILLEPESYGSVDFLPYLKITGDLRTVYTIHNYEPQEIYTHQPVGGKVSYPGPMDLNGDGTQTMVDRTWQATHLQPLSDFKTTHHVPIAVTEMGAHRFVPGVIPFLSDQFDILDQMGASYALWEWRAQGDLYYDFDVLMGTDSRNQVADAGNPLFMTVKKYFTNNLKRG